MNFGFIPNDSVQIIVRDTGISQADVDRLHREYRQRIKKLKKELADVSASYEAMEERSDFYRKTMNEIVIRHHVYRSEAHQSLIWNALNEESTSSEIIKSLEEGEYHSAITLDDERYWDEVNLIEKELELLRAKFYVFLEFHESWAIVFEKTVGKNGLDPQKYVEANRKHRAEFKLEKYDYSKKPKPLDFDVMETVCRKRIDTLWDMCTEAADRCEEKKIKALAAMKTCRFLARDVGINFQSMEKLQRTIYNQATQKGFYHRYPIEKVKAYVAKLVVKYGI